MNCRECERRIAELLSGEIRAADEAALRRHALSCPTCNDRLRACAPLWDLLGGWEDDLPPTGLEQRVLRRIEQESRLEASARRGTPRGALAASVFLGTLASVVSIMLAIRHMETGSLPLLALAIGGAAWTGLYAGAFLAFFRGLRAGANDLGRLAGVAIAGSLGSLLFFVFCPVTSKTDVCHMLPFMTPLFGWAGGYPAYFVLGVMSAVLPTLVIGAAAAARIEATPRSAALTAGCLIAVLLAPAFFLQMAPFSLGVLVVALLGGVSGSFTGSFAGTLLGLWSVSRHGWGHAR